MTTPRPPNDPYLAVPKLGELRDNVLFGDVWERAELNKRDRSLITVAVLIAGYRTEELKGHMARALDNGVSADELREVVTHVTFYAGWPTGVNAARVLKEVFDARGIST
jgi:4-carboxymuconolactone decarboxylase